MAQFEGRIGTLISGVILRFDGANVRVDVGRTEGFMPSQERIPTERLNISQRLTFLLKEIRETERGRDVILSRSDAELVKKLFAREVPEIASGSVEIKAIAREAGARTKIAVSSNQSGVDPVGSCVGQKGVRVQAVINELNGEKIDVIPWTENPADLIVSSLAPAEGVSVVLDEEKKEAKVRVPEDQLSLAIGREGQNVRLAVHLTGWRIEIEGIPGEKKEEEVKAEEAPVETAETVVSDSPIEESAQTGPSTDDSVSQDDTQAQAADDSAASDDASVQAQDDTTEEKSEETPAENAEEKK
jgi:transcription termination/antitermination protein NusA